MRLACALLIASLASGQPAGSGVISGVVSEAPGSTPVRKAIVTLTLETTPRTWATARTDGSGRFRFTGLPPGRYQLRADKQGSGTAVYGADGPRGIAESIVLADGQKSDGLTLRFIRASEMSGHVYGPEGDPVANVNVQLFRASRNLGERVLVNFRDASADDRGEYRMADLPPGAYYLRATPPQQFSHEDTGTEDLAPQYYGGAREWKDASAVIVRSGASLHDLDFHLKADLRYPIRGHITGVPSLPAPPVTPQVGRTHGQGVLVSLRPLGEGAPGWRSGSEAQPPDFAFDLGRPFGGRYLVEAELHTGDRTFSASQIVDSSQPVPDVPLTLAPASDLRGRLRIEGELPPQAVSPRITLIRSGGFGDNRAVTPGPDGKFVVPQVPAGEWAMSVTPLPAGGFLKSARLGDRDVRFSRFPVEQGSLESAALEIVISMHSANVTGQVDAAEGEPRRSGIVLAPVGEMHNLARYYYEATATTGSSSCRTLRRASTRSSLWKNSLPPIFAIPKRRSSSIRWVRRSS